MFQTINQLQCRQTVAIEILRLSSSKPPFLDVLCHVTRGQIRGTVGCCKVYEI